MTQPDFHLEEVIRIEGAKVVASLIRFTGDFTLAEDAFQEAAMAALDTWNRSGIPANPAAWLTTTARNKALDKIRRESERTRREVVATHLAHDDGPVSEEDLERFYRDDQLRLLFTCCHPALAPDARVALALRTIGGLTTEEIARVFLVSDTTMGQRLSRAKKKITLAGIPYRVPDDHELPDRLPSVLATIYAIFTAGHHPATGGLRTRVDLTQEGVRLARLVCTLMPGEPECMGLLALVMSVQARMPARSTPAGEAILLKDQDRTKWDHAAIAEASNIVEQALRRRNAGPYQIQAAISCLHGTADTFASTDWPQIAELYRLLEEQQPSAVIRVNRCVAVAEAFGPQPALNLLDTVDRSTVDRWHLYWVTRADLLTRLGDSAGAATALDHALDCDMNDADRTLLQERRRSLAES